jgi:hypothetical protein
VASDRIVVDDDGIEVIRAAQGRTPAWTTAFPWEEIHSVAVMVSELPDGERWVELDVSLIYGEFTTISARADGFADAVTDLARLGGVPVPDLATLDTDYELWRMPTP